MLVFDCDIAYAVHGLVMLTGNSVGPVILLLGLLQKVDAPKEKILHVPSDAEGLFLSFVRHIHGPKMGDK